MCSGEHRNCVRHVDSRRCDRWGHRNGRGSSRLRMSAAGEPVDEVIWRPGAGKLQDTFLHHGAGGREFVLVALNTFAIDQMCDIQQHLATFSHPAAYFFV